MRIADRFPKAFALLAAGGRSYGQAVVVLCLNVPLLLVALGRYPQGLSWAGLGGLYAGLVFLGYYVLGLLLLLTGLFLITGASRRLFLAASGTVLALALFYFLVDGLLFRILRIHLDAFWLTYMLTTFDGVGVGAREVLLGTAALAAIGALEWWLFRVAPRLRAHHLWVAGLTVACALAFAASQALHVVAFEKNDARITALTPQLPFYYPVVSHADAVKYGNQLSMIGQEEEGDTGGEGQTFRYPLRDVPCTLGEGQRRPNIVVLLLESWREDMLDAVVTPQMFEFLPRASRFLTHFSSGNSTPAGGFPVFYGIHSTYWAAVKGNNARIHNPVLIDALEANGYAFGIFANSHFERHKIKDAVFRDIEVHESFAGSTDDARDRDMTDQLFAFLERQQAAGTPSLTFAFYKSTHYPYFNPPGVAPFQPAAELNVIRASGADDPTPVLNDYRNSVHYVDSLIGDRLQRMDSKGLLEDSIVVITSDHGEEFNDNRSGYWGHTGNFTQYQTRVPLIVYVPWLQPRVVKAVTSQVDLAPTLLQEGLGCGGNAEDYSNGLNLFGPLPDRRPVIVSSYVNHAVILGEDVFVSWPLYVQRYKLDGSKAETGWPEGGALERALKEIGRFYAR